MHYHLFTANAIYLRLVSQPALKRYPTQGNGSENIDSPPFLAKTCFYLLHTAEILESQSPKLSCRNHQGMVLSQCHTSWPTTIANVPGLFFSSLCPPQSNLNCKLEKSCSQTFPLGGWTPVTSVSTHCRTAQFLVTHQSQLHQWLESCWAVQVGGQENRWPIVLSPKSMSQLPTVQVVLAGGIGDLSAFLHPKRIMKYKMFLYSESNITWSWPQPALIRFFCEFLLLSVNSNHVHFCHISVNHCIHYRSGLLALNLI